MSEKEGLGFGLDAKGPDRQFFVSLRSGRTWIRFHLAAKTYLKKKLHIYNLFLFVNTSCVVWQNQLLFLFRFSVKKIFPKS